MGKSSGASIFILSFKLKSSVYFFTENELCSPHAGFEKMKALAESTKKELSAVTQQNELLKSMISSLGLDFKQFFKSKREQNSTSAATKPTTRHHRRKEAEKALKFIHGGGSGSFYGAWDYIVANAPKELVGEFITGYQRGKYIQEVFEKAMKEHQASPEALKKTIATKYQNFLSRRNFNLVCKTQTSYFNAESEVWVPRNVRCVGVDLRVPQPISNAAVDKFVKQLNIGAANQIRNAPGVSRTVTGLVFMIIDLHLRVPHLMKKLVWFSEMENHFIFQFFDDGAPQRSPLKMSIGSLTMWNLGDRVRSSDFQYLLHCSHFQSRVPPHCQSVGLCNCGRDKDEESDYCDTCLECDEIVKSAQSQKLSENLINILKPQSCTLCGERFADKSMLEVHVSAHGQMTITNKSPKNMTVAELKSELRKLNVSTVGTKDILIKRLDMKIAGGC
ncbi:hypothetical protein AWC38_SpisGene16729 [Stylophora pistillata]|uniref:SAP domain-containing protein n=1 Tax=Stylophora pistillata TaxID=50429 RepID=A0A2B4RQQ4_STYPI|nr:hypothetical protein AWC38_SpisGene16729 [Stylophora pistillata]